ATASGNGPFTYLVKGPSSFSFTTNTSSTSITVPTGAGAGTYSNLVTSVNGCNSTLATAVGTVNPKPTAGLTGTTVCAGDAATNLTATASGNGPFTYLVKGPGSFSFTTNTSSTSITVPTGAAAGTYSNLVTSINGCNSPLATAVVTVNPKPTAGLTGTTVCAGDAATNLTATASGNGSFTYLVKGPSSFSFTTNTSSTSITVPTGASAGTYSNLVTSVDGCIGALATATVTVNPQPTAGLTGTTVCAGDAATNLTATASGNGPFTYLVKGPGGFNFTTNTSSANITVPTGAGAGTYSNLVTSVNGCNSALATA